MRRTVRAVVALVASFSMSIPVALGQANAPAQPPMPPAEVPPPPPPPPPPQHPWYRPVDSTAHRHLGFFIRPDLGLGYAESSASSIGSKMSGFAGSFGVAIGGAVAENLILSGHLYGVSVTNPTLTQNGVSQSTSDTDFTFVGIGPELDYYFMPANVYVSATVALTRQSVKEYGYPREDTDTGFGFELGAGKEWWVSDHWGLGIAGKFAFSSNKATGVSPPTWDAWGLTAVFSATYN